ncbi:hypothetical protein BH10PSE4_BH10PSE4_08270 [soil metagenome]
MATIVIHDTSPDYPFISSDNVFGIPIAFNYTGSSGGGLGLYGAPVTTEDDFAYHWTYPSGSAGYVMFWNDNGATKATETVFDLGTVSASEEKFVPTLQYSGWAYQVRTAGITLTLDTPIYVSGSWGHGGGPAPTVSGFFRAFDPSLPATYLAGNDRISTDFYGALMNGYAGDDTIVGGPNSDTLVGGLGKDILEGGQGSDDYYVDFGDTVVEAEASVYFGYDTIYTGGAYALPDGVAVERIVATGTGPVALTGNTFFDLDPSEPAWIPVAPVLVGNSGINVLDDGGGAATMEGGAGNDVYVVHNAAAVVTELADEGYDGVLTDLAAYTLGVNVETLTRQGGAAFRGTGNALSNALTGGTGSDTLDGAAANDVLTGGQGADHFRFDGPTFGQDQITDFLSGTDVIELSGAGFGLASLAGVTLVVDGTATAAGTPTLHYYANGGLSFDANGGGAGDAVFFATLQGHPSLAITDFQLV